MLPLVLTTAALLAAAEPTPREDDPPVVTQRALVESMVDLAGLPYLDGSTWSGVSTWNRAGTNRDGEDYQEIDGRTVVLADFEGPGCVTRFRAGHVIGRLRIRVDGRLVVDMDAVDFFRSQRFPLLPPLALQTPRISFFCFVPMPFQESFRAEVTTHKHGRRSFPRFFQAQARHFPEGTRVEPFDLDWDEEARAALEHVRRAWEDPRSVASDGHGEVDRIERSVPLAPGEVGDLAELSGAGAVRELRLRIDSDDPFALRTTELRIHWDGADEPAVAAPLGAFFGSDAGGREFHTLPMGMDADGTFYCRFRMPFRDGARVLAENRGPLPVAIRLELAYEPRESLPVEAGYFHARWRARLTSGPREDPNLAGVQNYFIAASEGGGRYVGTSLDVFRFRDGWWGEGDPFLWIDAGPDTWPPTFHGTGTEEYFNGGWKGFNATAIAGFVPLTQEQVGKPTYPWTPDDEPRGKDTVAGRTLVHSWHLTDFPIFQRSFWFSIEHGAGNRRNDRFASTAYWYLDRPASTFPQPPIPAGEEPFARPHVGFEEILALHAPETALRTLQLMACFGHHDDPSVRERLRALLEEPEFAELTDQPVHAWLADRLAE